MYDFNYHRPDSLAKAKQLFADGDDAVYLAGGHTLLPSMKQRLRDPSDLIDLSAIEELHAIGMEDDTLVIGALATHDSVARAPEVLDKIPALGTLAGGIGDAQVRNRGTIGGSVANSDPAADYPAGVLGLGATVITDEREIAADDFFTGMFETALNDGELITRIRFPVPDKANYIKFANPASRYATVGVFVACFGDDVRVAITGAAPTVFRASDMERALAADFSAEALSDIELDPTEMNTDLHASAGFRAHLCTVMAKRAVAAIS